MKNLRIIACSVLRLEIESLIRDLFPEAKVLFMDSMLHMSPEKLFTCLESKLQEEQSPALLIYGDCHPFMKDMEKKFSCLRTPSINCAHLLLGDELYFRFRNQKVFLFLPEWTKRWKEIFQKHLGFSDPERASEFMHENQKELVYLDTGLIPVPKETLTEISIFFKMQVGVHRVSLEPFKKRLTETLKNLEQRLSHGS